MELTRPTQFREAVDKLGSRSPIGSRLSSEEWSGVPVGLRERAFFSAKIEDTKFLQSARDTLNDFLRGSRERITKPDGSETLALKTGSRADFVMQMRKLAVESGLGDLVPEDKRGGLEDITSNRRLSLIFDVQTTAAYEFGNWKQGQDPDVIDEFPAQRFIREREVKHPRAIHQSNEGVVRRKDDLAFWLAMNSESFGGFGVPWGPWGFGSGMGVEDVGRSEAEALGLVSEDEVVKPHEAEFNDHLKASVTGLDSDLSEKLRSDFGNQISFSSGEAIWNPPKIPKRRQVSPSNRSTPKSPQTGPSPQRSAPSSPASQPPAAVVPPIRRAPAVPLPLLAPPPAAPVPKPVPGRVPPGIPKVSDAVDLSVARRAAPIARRALEAINSVHGDGTIESFPTISGAGGAIGVTSLKRGNGAKVVSISHVGIRLNGPWPELTACHEYGHVLDLGPLSGYSGFATHKATGPASEIVNAARKSLAWKALEDRAVNATSRRDAMRTRGYLMSEHEVFARAYAQFVAEESGDPKLAEQLAKRLSHPDAKGEQWEAADFAPISAAFKSAFSALGWMQ